MVVRDRAGGASASSRCEGIDYAEAKVVLDIGPHLWYTVGLVMSESEFVRKNIELAHLPRTVDNLLSTLAHLRGMTKKALIQEALVEYVDRHRDDISRLVKGGKISGDRKTAQRVD